MRWYEGRSARSHAAGQAKVRTSILSGKARGWGRARLRAMATAKGWQRDGKGKTATATAASSSGQTCQIFSTCSLTYSNIPIELILCQGFVV